MTLDFLVILSRIWTLERGMPRFLGCQGSASPGLEEAREERQEGLGGGFNPKRKRLSFGHNLSQTTSRMVMNQRALKFFSGHECRS